MAKKPQTATFSRALHLLQISEDDFRELMTAHKISIVSTEFGPGIAYTDLMRLAYLPQIPDLARKALLADAGRKEHDAAPHEQQAFERAIEQMLKQYSEDLDTIIAIHAKYDAQIRPLFSKTPEAAAYSLLARAMSLMHMVLTAFHHRHFEAIVLLRLIDEAANLAEYFLIERDTPQGKKDLHAWYCENYSPSQSVCRASIDKWFAQMPISAGLPSMGALLNDLYDAKSKPVHNAHHSIMEGYKSAREKGQLVGLGFEYGDCSNLRKLHELVEFAKSSIWTLVQSISICFMALHRILDKSDIDVLTAMNQRLGGDMHIRRGFQW